MRLALVTNVPAPYRLPLYALLEDRLKEDNGALRVFFGARIEPRNQWARVPSEDSLEFPAEFLNERPATIRGRVTYVDPRIALRLRRFAPTVVVVVGYAPWIFSAVAWCRAAHVPYLIWSAETPDSAIRHGARWFLRAPLARHAAGFLAYGPSAQEYLTINGVGRDLITVIGNGIAIDDFAMKVDDARLRRASLKVEMGLGESVILCVGGKGLDVLIPALDLLEPSCELLVVGTDRRPTCGSHRVKWLGKVNRSRMHEVYAASECLAHLSTLDRWPHAINEALSAGLPVVGSQWTGVPDAILGGPGCTIVRDIDPPEVAKALDEALRTSRDLDASGRAAIRDGLRPYDVSSMVERLLAAAASVER